MKKWKWRHFSKELKIFIQHNYDKNGDNRRLKYKIEDLLKKLKYNDKHRNKIRIQLKKKVEIFSDRTRFSSKIYIQKLRIT